MQGKIHMSNIMRQILRHEFHPPPSSHHHYNDADCSNTAFTVAASGRLHVHFSSKHKDHKMYHRML